MDSSKKIKRIIGSNRLNPKEIKELELFLDGFNSDEEVQQWLNNNWKQAAESLPETFFETSIQRTEPTNLIIIAEKQKRKSLRINMGIAASIAAILGVFLYAITSTSTHEPLAQLQHLKTTEQLHQQSIIFTQGNQSYNLSTSNIDIKDSNINVVGTQHNLKLVANSTKSGSIQAQKWSTLKVPRGMDYYVVLSDSTQVWMNACSEISFPDYFINGKREIRLKGEAYFIVKSDIHNPFHIKTPISTVEVTGTKFNVCNYPEEHNSLITLVEGKVTVATANSRHIIAPGQQLVQNISGEVQIKEVNPYQYISWKDGIFEFNDMSLQDMSLRLSKWYDVQFQFQNNQVASQRFTGIVKKEHTLEYFIKILEKTSSLRFTVNGTDIAVNEK